MVIKKKRVNCLEAFYFPGALEVCGNSKMQWKEGRPRNLDSSSALITDPEEVMASQFFNQ